MDEVSSEKVPVFPNPLYWTLALLSATAISVYLARTRGGLRLLAVGNDPDKSRQMGVDPVKVRYLALIGTGVLAGLGGVLILSNAQSFSDNMVAGRGFIALAALILGGWRPWPTLAACLLFGAFFALQLQLKGTPILGADVPTAAWTALPYAVTIIALAGFLGRSKAPSGLGKP
jgi:simple sugar transport system permease protein